MPGVITSGTVHRFRWTGSRQKLFIELFPQLMYVALLKQDLQVVHTHKHPWLCIALYTTVNVVVTYGDFMYISVHARTYLNRIKQDGLNPYSTMTLRSVTRNHMLINSALRFSQADCPFRFFLKKTHLLQ